MHQFLIGGREIICGGDDIRDTIEPKNVHRPNKMHNKEQSKPQSDGTADTKAPRPRTEAIRSHRFSDRDLPRRRHRLRKEVASRKKHDVNLQRKQKRNMQAQAVKLQGISKRPKKKLTALGKHASVATRTGTTTRKRASSRSKQITAMRSEESPGTGRQ